MGLLSEKVDLNSWPPGFSPLQANAFYIYQRNQIFIPLGILQSPFFNIEQPKALNYGLLGSIIGHEVCSTQRASKFNKSPGKKIVKSNKSILKKNFF